MIARRLRDQRGFTLTELLIVIAILGFMMTALFTLQRQGQATYQAGAARVEVQQNARIALDLMMNDIRTATAVTFVGGTCNNATDGTTTITVTDQTGTAVAYAVTGAGTNLTLTRNGEAVIGGVRAFRIWCYDATNARTATAASVRTVQAQIVTQTERGPTAGNQAGNQHAIAEGRVRLRNVI